MASEPQLHVCAVLENGFSMLRSGVASASAVCTDADLRGFDVDLRAQVLAGYNVSVSAYSSYGEAQYRTRIGECDIAWGNYFQTSTRERCVLNEMTCRAPLSPLELAAGVDSWTPYRCCIDYTVAYLPTVMAILHNEEVREQDFFVALFSVMSDTFFFNFLSFTILCVFIFAHLLWFAEREHNEAEFPQGYWKGIEASVWCAAATWSTVGYGDKAPKSPVGRMLSIWWMVSGITLCSILTGHMASAFAENSVVQSSLGSITDLVGKRVCSWESIFAMPAVLPSHLEMTRLPASEVDAMIQMLIADEADAIVLEMPILRAWVKNNNDLVVQHGIKLSGPVVPIPVAAMVPEDSPHLENLNLRLLQAGLLIAASYDDWFPKPEDQGAGAPPSVRWGVCAPALTLVALWIGQSIRDLQLLKLSRWQLAGPSVRPAPERSQSGAKAKGPSSAWVADA